MYRLAMVILPDAFLASVGAMSDSYSLVRERLGRIVFDEARELPEMTLTVLSMDGRPVPIVGGGTVAADSAMDEEDRFDFIWLPSFQIGSVDSLKDRLASSEALLGWLRGQAAAGAAIGASGSSALLLVAARLLDGKPVPVSRVFLSTLRSIYPRCLSDDRLASATYGKIFVSQAIGHDFTTIANAISETISPSSGRWLAEVTANETEGPGHLSSDPLVASVQMWIEQLYATDLTVAGLAERLSISPQTLARRFRNALNVTPKAYMQQMRLKAAQGMLAGSNRSIEEIARFVGYSDVRLFRRAFRNEFGESARDWRLGRQRYDQRSPSIDT